MVSQPAPRVSLRAWLSSLSRGRMPRRASDGTPLLDGSGVEHRMLETCRPVVPEDIPDADIIIATWWETAYWVSALPEEKGRQVYFMQHHEVHDHLYWQLSRGSYFLPMHKIAVSRWIADIVRAEYGDPDVWVLANGIDLEHFQALARGPQAIPTVGLMYVPTTFKGTDVSLAAIRKARERLPELELVAFGLDNPVSSMPLPDNTRYHRNPSQHEIPGIYASCDAWLFGSRQEGFGLPLLEAMACRCPVVATRAGAAPDLIEEGVNGYVVDLEDSDALADRLVTLLSQPAARWQEMSDAAHRVAQGCGWESSADRLERILLDLVS